MKISYLPPSAAHDFRLNFRHCVERLALDVAATCVV
jgi:hypothetical protein